MGSGGLNESTKPGRSKLVLMGGLALIAAAVGVRALWSGPQSAPAALVPEVTLPPAPTQGSAGTGAASTVAPAVIAWPKMVARDPFQSSLVYPPAPKVDPKVDPTPVVVMPPTPAPDDVAALAKATIHLKGTVLGDKPIAMMNGRVYRIGEYVEGFRVVQIEKRRVVVERDGAQVAIEEN
jgi:hypothetical protein